MYKFPELKTKDRQIILAAAMAAARMYTKADLKSDVVARIPEQVSRAKWYHKKYYCDANDWHVVAVPVVDLKQRRFGKPVSLFRLPDEAEYDVVNGKRFLVNEPVGPATAPLFVIANWRPEPPKSE